MPPDTQQTLAMFVKYWQPGRVKTRLGDAIGAAEAARVYEVFVRTLVDRLRATADVRLLAFSPPECRDEFEALCQGTSWQPQPQTAGHLGERMRRFFETAFARGSKRVVLIGSDSPNVPLETIEDAFSALETQDAVLGPSDDGGYYLLGLSGGVPPIFDGIAWSSPQVFQQTTARLEQHKNRYHVLPEFYDVDDLHSLQRLAADLEYDHCPEFKSLRSSVQGVLERT